MIKIPSARILVIDDNPRVVDILATVLSEEATESPVQQREGCRHRGISPGRLT